jgi:transglutaminase-like putative cysteine protease
LHDTGREPLKYTLRAIPDGVPGTRETLKLMRNYVHQYRKAQPIRELALSIIRDVSGHKNFTGQVRALHAWVQRNVQYVRDIRDVETLQTPVRVLETRQGDCDDQATFLSALLEAAGFHTRFVAIKVDPLGPFVHVFTEVNLGTRWFPLETTERWPAGKMPRVSARMVQNV